jgi:hypothetical protein
VPAKMAPVQAALHATSDTVSELSGHVLGLAPATEKASESFQAMGTEVRGELGEARDTTELLGEAVGVRLPRAVGRFLADLPAVGTALNAAFGAFAIIFLIDWITKGIEKIVELQNAGKEIEDAWAAVEKAQDKTFQGLEDNLLRAQIRTAELSGNHLEALRLKLQLIDNTTLGKLDSELEKLGQEADKAFAKMNRSFFSALFSGLDSTEGGDKAKQMFEDISKEVDKALNSRSVNSFSDALAILDKAADETDKKLGKLTEQQKKFADAQKTLDESGGIERGASQLSPKPVDPLTLESYQKLRDLIKGKIKDTEEADRIDQEENKAANDEERTKQLEQQAQVAKRTLDARLAGIEQEKSSQHALFAEGAIDAGQWSLAQSKAANDAAKAQDDYKDKLASLAKQGVDGSKAMAAAQDAATEKVKQQNKLVEEASTALTKAQSETAKLREEMEKLVFPVEKAKEQVQAFKELEAAENRLAEVQKTLAQAQVSSDFSQQKAAVTQLANLRVVSKQQEAQLLARLNQQEEREAMVSLNQLLSQQEQALNAAKAKFQAASKDALFPPAELAQLKTHLDQAQTAWDKTQTEIIKRKASFDNQSIALDKSYYGQALALAIAFGNQDLAVRLKENHAAILAAQANLAEAKARKDDTHAIEQQIKSLQKLEKELTKEARAENKGHAQLMAEFGQTSKAIGAYETELDASGKKTAAWGAGIGTVLEGVAEAYAQGATSAEQAFARVAAAEIGAIAQVAEKEGTKQLALALGSYPDFGGMAHHFAAAALWFTLGGALSAGAGALSGGGGGSSSSSGARGTPGPAPGSPAAAAGGVPVSTLNVPRLSGGLVTQSSVAVVGGVPGGGSAMKQIAAALASHGSSGGDIHIKIETDLLSSARVISNNVKTGRVRMTSSNTLSPRGRRS